MINDTIPKIEIEKKFQMLCNTRSDINEHLPTLKKYSENCDTIVELGIRYVVSSWAFLAAEPKRIISVDIKHPNEWDELGYPNSSKTFESFIDYCKKTKVKFDFFQKDSKNIDLPHHDILFIDTLHDYEVLKEELKLHSKKTKKYIILHDTNTFKDRNESGGGIGLIPAIEEFLTENKDWKIKEIFYNNNGMTILSRI